jgi:hypothetical protein
MRDRFNAAQPENSISVDGAVYEYNDHLICLTPNSTEYRAECVDCEAEQSTEFQAEDKWETMSLFQQTLCRMWHISKFDSQCSGDCDNIAEVIGRDVFPKFDDRKMTPSAEKSFEITVKRKLSDMLNVDISV